MRKVCFADTKKFSANYSYRVGKPYKFLAPLLRERGIESVDRFDADGTLYFWKFLMVSGMETVAILRRRGANIAVDCEDNPYIVCPWWKPSARKFFTDLFPKWDKFFALANRLVATTPTLADTLANKLLRQPTVLPNLIDRDDFPKPLPRKKGECTILWCGSESHSGDLGQLADPLKFIKQRYPHVRIVFWGHRPPSDLVGHVEYKSWSRYAFYHRELMRLRPDIGLCPLADSPSDGLLFNSCKSNIKWLEYSMAGAATIASNQPPYAMLRNRTDGILVDRAWYDAIASLIEDPSLRETMKRNSQVRVEQEFSWQSSAAIKPWLEFMESNA